MKKSKSAGTDMPDDAGQEIPAADAAVKDKTAESAAPEATAPESGAPESVAGTAPSAAGDPCQEIKNALAAKEQDFNVLTDKYLRLAAEYDNFRRRSQKEKDALYVDSIVLVIRELLPVLDNLNRAELSASQFDNEEAKRIAEGLDMIRKQVDQALTRLGVSVIECVGQPFNPELHEAVMHVQDDNAGASVIVAELQRGYRRDDRVIRHSMVTVAN
ncbi:MAG TPA: nucleotide exchange factor GrpE [Clostridiales bacterium]|nr:nucleotide exchange factor GrpE [Clostridiales bacterium]